MTKLRAEVVLNDCKLALSKFDGQLIDDEFRLNLVLNLALLRAVGHCIKNEVGIRDTLFATKSTESIYNNFIKDYRDEILKNYNSSVDWSLISINDDDSYEVKYLITKGTYENKDVRHVIAEAIEWWERYIEELKIKL